MPYNQLARRRTYAGPLMRSGAFLTSGALALRQQYEVAKRRYENQKKRKKPEGPRRAVKKRRGKVKIGSFAGRLIASKPVRKPKIGARVRERQFGNNGDDGEQNRCWLTGSSVGSEYYFCTLIAEAYAIYILRAVRDYRTDKQNSSSDVISQLSFGFAREDSGLGDGSAMHETAVMMLNHDSSVDGIVRNNGSTPNTVTFTGQAEPNPGLARMIWEMALRGYYPSSCMAFRHDTDGDSQEIYRDTNMHKAQITIDISGLFKFQNITPADSAGGAENNANAIDANPLSGKIATFRNLCPRWNPGWLQQQPTSTINLLENFSGRPEKLVGTLDNWHYAQASRFNLPDIEELEAMPARMRTVFSNAKTSTKVHFPPGGYKTFKTRFTYSGSLFKLLRDLTQVTQTESGSGATINGKYPSLGDSFALCVVPTMKSETNERVKMQYDYQRDGFASIKRYTGGGLPTTNLFQ